ncbi:hypothetical protein L226DRAFT_534238 [Lentinus tigrinus ALCF2SS1-7]|uniref:Yeast cell wall synthesis Kre9/Knh1-like N-terminal domain-containing protein n=1 Tax=Lentinus tigrinus ALCF2SS1-6 TaxID=1328759 RepID=A0A5C2SCW6_9APHY|nr:hypothetical protein L227DRAFT_610049 [Lentinus tigrinus ALCF2SS1-6]RPD76185.1 hypothetical protein L226DRAFT_534238 [Lentinus tigrinus ALCF2SS1-7]
MFSSALLILAAVAPAFATIYTTSPVGTTAWTAGQQQTISWQDDGSSPSLADFGNAKVSVYVGNAQQQTMVQSISDSVNVASTSSIVFTPDASVGENGAYYFIRFESLALKDATNSAYPALAFSSKYTMSGMTGTFSADVKAQIAAASGTTSAAAAPATTSAAAGTTTSSKIATSKAATGTSASASSTGSASAKAGNGASTIPVSVLTCAAGVAVAVFSAMFM